MESMPSGNSTDRYSVEEVAGTLFLKYGNLVLAANIGEEGTIADTVRKHFASIVCAMNAELDADAGPCDGTDSSLPAR